MADGPAFMRISVENLVTVALLSAFAYFGFLGATLAVAAVKARTGMLGDAKTS